MLIEPESGRAYEDEFLRAAVIQRCDFRREHPAHRMTDEVGGGDFQIVHQLVIEQRRIDDIIYMLVACGFAVAGKMWRIDLMRLAQVFEERIDAEQTARAVEEQQRIAAAEFPHLDGKFTARKLPGGLHL